jgi:glycerol-3-phosphate dehydrogenase
MWSSGWRDSIWIGLDRPWQIIVIGGGITGAGIFRQASQAGLRTLLVEANDFAFGTSSRSSKLVHGGFRYLANRQFNVTYESVQERERLLREAPNLVRPLQFIIPVSNLLGQLRYQVGVILYDLMAPKWRHGIYSPEELHAHCPLVRGTDQRGIHYLDAKVDDARLVIRTIREGVLAGGVAINYAEVEDLLTQRDGAVQGVILRDRSPTGESREAEVQAEVVVNATGPWSDRLRQQLGLATKLRRTRGSHLLFPRHKLPTDCSFTLEHPIDGRTVFTVPWENTTLIGTTDVDQPSADEAIDAEPAISPQEFDYLLAAIRNAFPQADISAADVLATFAGLRPLVDSGEDHPSKVSRGHVILEERGMLSVMGGKLTTYRLMAHQTLERACAKLSDPPSLDPNRPILDAPPELDLPHGLSADILQRLLGRYGSEIADVLAESEAGELEPIDETHSSWAQIRWAARHEGIIHLDDLLLRRVRIGLMLPAGATSLLDQVDDVVRSDLGWDDARWNSEVERYRRRWVSYYSPRPGPAE